VPCKYFNFGGHLLPMKKIFYLATCNTCKKILDSLENIGQYELREIKSETISEEEVDEMARLAGSYEALFSRRAMKYKALGLKDKALSEGDYKNYIVEEYTFLKRPVLLSTEHIFVGNAKKTVDAMQAFLANEQ
jgi:arsenate reductase